MGAELVVERSRGRSVVSTARSSSPLRLLVPSGGGHAAWVFQSSLGGGFVGTDDVSLRVEVAAGASLWLSSQASSKVYRGARSRFVLDASVRDGATLVTWPDPVVCFAGATFDQTQRFSLAPTASLIAVDAWTAGRVGRGERWAFDRLTTRLAIEIDGTMVLDDAMLLSNAHGDLSTRLGSADAFAMIAIAGIACDALAAEIAARPLGWPLITASRWPWGLVIRIAATTTESLVHAMHELLRGSVIAAIDADPWTRKW
ncbi:MAG TPA: urease accessory protein UreD [Kofleriaceae bacterium]|nr:urease accessory protein UreD [Kofleriaceae bacterium]